MSASRVKASSKLVPSFALCAVGSWLENGEGKLLQPNHLSVPDKEMRNVAVLLTPLLGFVFAYLRLSCCWFGGGDLSFLSSGREHERRGRTAWLSAWALCSTQIDFVAQHEEWELLWVVRACVYQKLEDTRRNSFLGKARRPREQEMVGLTSCIHWCRFLKDWGREPRQRRVSEW